jgi:hypothetical protein
MKKVYPLLFAALLLQLACSQATFASGNSEDKGKVVEKPVAADTPEKFAATADDIRSEMGPNGRYEYIKSGDKAKVEADLNSMAALLQKAGSVGAMKEQERIRLFNTQEHLNGILVHNDSNRLVCERRAPVGTNIPVNTCKTVGQIEKERTDSQKMMLDQQSNGWKCNGGSCNGH